MSDKDILAENMFSALMGIQTIAHNHIVDICAIIQEGGSWTAIDRMELLRWDSVIQAVQKWCEYHQKRDEKKDV